MNAFELALLKSHATEDAQRLLCAAALECDLAEAALCDLHVAHDEIHGHARLVALDAQHARPDDATRLLELGVARVIVLIGEQEARLVEEVATTSGTADACTRNVCGQWCGHQFANILEHVGRVDVRGELDLMLMLLRLLVICVRMLLLLLLLLMSEHLILKLFRLLLVVV